MKIFVPDSGHIKRRQYCIMNTIGNLYSPHRWRTPANPLYIVENGAYPAFLKGEKLNEALFYRAIGIVAEYETAPYFVVVPDIVRGGLKSLTYSIKNLPKIPDDLKKYVVIQKGIEEKHITPLIGSFHGIFMGGGDPQWQKARIGQWITFSHDNGLLFHKGRTGPREYTLAYLTGADSVDGSTPARHRQLSDITRWRATKNEQRILNHIDGEEGLMLNIGAAVAGDRA